MARRFTSLSLALIIGMIGVLAAASAVSANHFGTFTTTLSGSEEAPGAGDANGKGFATLDVYNNGLVCYTLKTQAIETPTVAHIHEAPAGVAGDVVVDLRIDLATQKGNRLTYCANAGEDVVADIRANAADYYVNVHNDAFAGGAVRGQLGD
ncbi:MAG: CHRD domain-containing protein [Candidatus Limnocylindria bacterium]